MKKHSLILRHQMSIMDYQHFIILFKNEEISCNAIRITVMMNISLCIHHENQEHTLQKLVQKFGQQMVDISTRYAIFMHVPSHDRLLKYIAQLVSCYRTCIRST